jgi:hypothetical protein
MRLAFVAVVLIANLLASACGGVGGVPPGNDGSPFDAGPVDAMEECAAEPTECDYFLHCGCLPSTEKCSAGGDGPECFEVLGAKIAGQECAFEEECARGLVCVPYGGTSQCMAFCDDSHPCPADQACYIAVNDLNFPASEIGRVCGQICSLRSQDCDFSSQGCYTTRTYAVGMENGICITAGAGTQGTACERSNDCSEGFVCVDVEGPTAAQCVQLCDRSGGEPTCGQGSCQALAGHTQTGVCLTPN